MSGKVFALGAIFAFFALSGCGIRCGSPAYETFYSHLKTHKPPLSSCTESENYLLLLVHAPHLDYSDAYSLLRTLVKHPTDGSKNGDVGHAWILLTGIVEGRRVVVEGGHSGELGITQPRYFDGVMNYIECGCNNEPNPVKYLWETQSDGFFQTGSGGHRPTYAIKINLTQEQFYAILGFIDPDHYDYRCYAITANQCSSFAAMVAQVAGLELSCEVTVYIPQKIKIEREFYSLWEDPCYSQLTISSPDVLEKSMMSAVEEGRAEYALSFYFKKWRKKKCLVCLCKNLCQTLSRFPYRLQRAQSFR